MERQRIEPGLMDVATSARILSISPFTLRRHISLGNVVATRIGRRVLIRRETVEEIERSGLPSLCSANKSRS